ncbi:calexcitin-2-like [Aphomia sociella]
MVSDFRKKKLLHVFTVFFDTNKSGNIDKKDFDLAIENITKLRGWSAGDAKYNEVKNTLLKVWSGLQGHADSNKDGEVSFEEWVSIWDDYAKNPAAAPEWQKDYSKFIFQLEDSSNDGSIDSEEFSSVYAAFGLNKEEASAAFTKMSQGKSNVSWDDFQGLWKEYFTSENVNAPGNFIFGKTGF